MLLALWFDFWDSGAWIPPTLSDFWCAMTGSSSITGGGNIQNLG